MHKPYSESFHVCSEGAVSEELHESIHNLRKEIVFLLDEGPDSKFFPWPPKE